MAEEPSDDPIGTRLPATIHPRPWHCPSCDNHGIDDAIVAVDWRNRRALARALDESEEHACPACGEPIPNQLALLVVRPGDPIAALAAFPTAGALEDQTRAIAELSIASRLGGDVVPINARDTAPVAGRYLGFELAGLAAISDPPGEAWLAAAREAIQPPDLITDLNRYLTSPSAEAGDGVIAGCPGLVDPVWRPVVAALGRQALDQQPDAEAAGVVAARLRRLERAQLLVGVVDDQEELPETVRARIDALLHHGSETTALDLAEAVELLADHDGNVLYPAALISLTVARLRDPARTAADLAQTHELAEAAVHATERVYGANHSATTTARVNLAAALIQSTIDTPTADLVELLAPAIDAAIDTRDPHLADVLDNLAAAYAIDNRTPRVLGAEQALRLFRDAGHLHAILHPDRPDAPVAAIVGRAAVLRGRLSGDPVDNAGEALAAYEQATALGHTMTTLDRLVLRSNTSTARFHLQRILPGSIDANELATELISQADELRRTLAPDHHLRLGQLANLAAMIGDLYSDTVIEGHPRPELLAACLALSEEAVADHAATYGKTAPETDRVIANHIANLSRPTPDATGLVDADAAISLAKDLLDRADDDHPALQAAVAANLARIHVVTRDWSAVVEDERRAVAATELLNRARVLSQDWPAVVEDERRAVAANELHRVAVTPATRFAERATAGEAVNRLVFALLRDGRPSEAIAAIEAGRGQLLAAADQERGNSPIPRPGADEVVVYCGVSARGSYGIIVTPDDQRRGLITDLSLGDVVETVGALGTARNARDRQGALARLSEPLVQGLLHPLSVMLADTRASRLTVVAGGVLSATPLHTLASSDGQTWLDRWPVRFVPSMSVLHERPSAPGPAIVVTNPTRDLAAGGTETEAVQRLGREVEIPPPSGRRPWLLERITSAGLLHLACHARHLNGAPAYSGFDLGDPRPLSVADLLDADLGALDLAVVPACGTAVVGAGTPDEMLGLGYALLYAGAHQVVASLWNVDDLATALIVHRFYAALEAGEQPDEALRQGQLWLRDVTVAELWGLARRGGALGDHLGGELHRRRQLRPWARPAARPFADPSWWGGLALLSTRR